MSPLQSVRGWVKYVVNPPKYLTASLIVSLGGLLNGLDTGTIGPVITMPSFISTFGELPAAVSGIVVSSLLLAATLSSLLSGTLSDRFGRPSAVAIGALFFAVGAALEAGAMNLAMILVGRSIVGFGEGLFLSTLVVYVCEITPPKERGLLASIVQVFVTIGIMLGYFICYGTVNWGSSLSWRFPIAFQAGIALFLAAMSYVYLPHSPRWLSYNGRVQEATAVWDKLGVSAAEREKDLEQSARARALPAAAAGVHQGLLGRMRQSVRNSIAMFGKGTRRQMFLGVFMMTMQQLSGIDGVMYYAPILFNQAGLSSSQATFLASGVSAILLCVSTILAFVFVDRWGRRATTLYGGLLLFACMSLLGILYATNNVHADYGAGKWVVIITIYVFAITYCTTWGLGVKLFASEIQPVATRATATSLAQSACCISNFFVAFITSILLARSSFGAYFLFAGCALLTVVVCAIFMPETRGDSLEAISESFSSHHVSDMALVRGIRKLASIIRRSAGAEGSSTSSGRSQRMNSTAGSEEIIEPVMMVGGAGTGSEETIEMGILVLPVSHNEP